MYCNYLLVREHDGDAVVQRVDVDHVAVAVVLLRQDVEHVLQVGKSLLACTYSAWIQRLPAELCHLLLIFQGLHFLRQQLIRSNTTLKSELGKITFLPAVI